MNKPISHLIFWTSLLLTSISLLSCSQEDTSEVISEQSQFRRYVFEIDSIRIDLDESQKFIYEKKGVVNQEGTLYFFGYNNFNHSIDIFDLTSEKFYKNLPLEREGPNGIPDVISFTPVSLNCLYILSTYQLSRINEKSVIEEKLALNSSNSNVKGHKSEDSFFWADANFQIYYDQKRNRLFGLNHSMRYGDCDRKRYTKAQLVSQIDLNSNRLSNLKIGYPVERQDNYYGFLGSINSSWSDDALIYNFINDPNIYVFDLENKSRQVFDGRSIYAKNEVEPIDWARCQDVNLKLRHTIEGVNFEKVFKDDYRGLYYRFHRGDLKNQDETQIPSYSDKKLYLTVFDRNLSKVEEGIIDWRHYPTKLSFVGARGLYIPAPAGEDKLAFDIFKMRVY